MIGRFVQHQNVRRFQSKTTPNKERVQEWFPNMNSMVQKTTIGMNEKNCSKISKRRSKKYFFKKGINLCTQYNRYFHRNNVLRFRTWPTPPELSAHHCIVSAKFHARALPSRISPNGCGFFGRAFLRSSIANKTRVFCPSATHPQSAGCTCRCANGGFAERRRTSVANPLATA